MNVINSVEQRSRFSRLSLVLTGKVVDYISDKG